MPLQEFECPQGHRHEKILERWQDYYKTPCPECGEMTERVRFPGSSFILKGEGWPGKDRKK